MKVTDPLPYSLYEKLRTALTELPVKQNGAGVLIGQDKFSNAAGGCESQ